MRVCVIVFSVCVMFVAVQCYFSGCERRWCVCACVCCSGACVMLFCVCEFPACVIFWCAVLSGVFV